VRQQAKNGTAVVVERPEREGGGDHPPIWGCSYGPKSRGSYGSYSRTWS
jgi:hypothetical protein